MGYVQLETTSLAQSSPTSEGADPKLFPLSALLFPWKPPGKALAGLPPSLLLLLTEPGASPVALRGK